MVSACRMSAARLAVCRRHNLREAVRNTNRKPSIYDNARPLESANGSHTGDRTVANFGHLYIGITSTLMKVGYSKRPQDRMKKWHTFSCEHPRILVQTTGAMFSNARTVESALLHKMRSMKHVMQRGTGGSEMFQYSDNRALRKAIKAFENIVNQFEHIKNV